jgi:hypothetical protein
VRPRDVVLLGSLALATQLACAQRGNMSVPKTVEAGNAFSIQTTGSGKAVLYIVGLGQALRLDVQLGERTSFPAGSVYNAGHYLAILVKGSPIDTESFDVVPASRPANLSFLAKPSRLSVGLHDGISGAVYVFDAYHNLITAPTPVSFELSNPSGTVQRRTVVTQHGAAWTRMDSSAHESLGKFVARADSVSSTRAVEQVPGDPCGLKMTARPAGLKVQLETAPVRDCSGNAVPDGTIVTFTEHYAGTQSTVDVPLKHGIAQVEMPAHSGARISVATGVVLGNEISWEK